MSETFASRTRGVILTWPDNRSVFLLFGTDSSTYYAQGSGSLGTGSRDCLFLHGTGVTVATNVFSSHRWNGSSRKHEYKLSISSVLFGDSLSLRGTLSYSYFDNEQDEDVATWNPDKGDALLGPNTCLVIKFDRTPLVPLVGRTELVFPVRVRL